MLAKAGSLPADEVFLDLEDSVALTEKNDQTRQNVVDALLTERWLAKTRVVRINGVSTRWWLRDLVTVAPGEAAWNGESPRVSPWLQPALRLTSSPRPRVCPCRSSRCR